MIYKQVLRNFTVGFRKTVQRGIDYVFYQGERVGKDGVHFRLWKIRTMLKEAGSTPPYSVGQTDNRIIWGGRFLRKTHLDELPNLINVLKGEMSLIGPRPDVPYYADRIPEPDRTIILSVKPGCIDPATLWNFNEGLKLKGKEDPDAFYEREIWPEKLKRQRDFILKWLNPSMKKCLGSEPSSLS